MTIPVVSAAIQAQLPPIPKLVLIDLADHADRDGRNSFPGLERLARESCIARNTARDKLKLLEKYGFIAKQDFPEKYAGKFPANRRPQCWTVLLDKHGHCCGRWPPKEGLDEESETATPNLSRGPNCGGQDLDPNASRGPNDSDQGSKSERSGVQELCTQPVNNQSIPCAAASANAERDTDGAQTETTDADTLISKWRRQQDWVDQRFGGGTWQAWHGKLVPEADDGKTLTLAAPSRFIADYFRQHYAPTTGEIIHRRIEVHHTAWLEAKVAKEKRATA